MTFSKTLLQWYSDNARDLPWRQTKNPYKIWISEIILQQTRIDQGLPYYYRFAEAFPDVKSLSEASEDQVLRIWQGLGYYSRARNMMTAARQIVNDFQGVFPDHYQDILKLKGVGPYTAAAISSISFHLPYAVVDGNVFRVLSRFFNIEEPINSSKGKKIFEKLAQENLITDNPGDYNQAIMEFGARMCVPKNPDCLNCPLRTACKAFEKSKVDELPVKLKTLKVKDRYLNFFLIWDGKTFLAEKRGLSGIWKGLWQFPLIEEDSVLNFDQIADKPEFQNIIQHQKYVLEDVYSLHHKLTHRNLFIQIFRIKVIENKLGSYDLLSISDFDQYAFPKPLFQYWEDHIMP